MTQHEPATEQPADVAPLEDRCIACGQPVQYYEALGGAPGWWDHVNLAHSLTRHRVVLSDDEPVRADSPMDLARLVSLHADRAAVVRLARAMATIDQSARPFRSWESEVEFILHALPTLLQEASGQPLEPVDDEDEETERRRARWAWALAGDPHRVVDYAMAQAARESAPIVAECDRLRAEVARLQGIVKAWQWKGWSEVLVPLPQGPMGPANAVLAWIRDFVEADS